MFKYRNKDEDKEYVFGFDFQYYKSFQHSKNSYDPNSGAYTFRPRDEYQESFKYSKLFNITSKKSGVAEEIQLQYEYTSKN